MKTKYRIRIEEYRSGKKLYFVEKKTFLFYYPMGKNFRWDEEKSYDYISDAEDAIRKDIQEENDTTIVNVKFVQYE